jgi:hypothetical protein
MPASRSPKEKAKFADKYAATTWGTNTEDLECPSGQVCLVRRVDPMKLIADGTLHKTDMVTMLVDQQHVAKKSKGGKRAAQLAAEKKTEGFLKEAIQDPTKMQELSNTIDAVVLATVVMPELFPVPDDDEDREPGVIYIDSVEFNDKLFIMQYAFAGTRDVARFRRELGESVDRLADGEPMEDKTE